MTYTERILMKDELNPESKVYLIARMLKDEGRLPVDLWYAILEMKDKHLKDIMTKETVKYLPFTIWGGEDGTRTED